METGFRPFVIANEEMWTRVTAFTFSPPTRRLRDRQHHNRVDATGWPWHVSPWLFGQYLDFDTLWENFLSLYIWPFEITRIIMTLIDRANCFRPDQIKYNERETPVDFAKVRGAVYHALSTGNSDLLCPANSENGKRRYDASRLSINIIFYLLEKCLEIRRRMLPEPCYPLIRGNFTPTASSPFSFPPSLFLHALPFTFSIRVKSIRRSTTRVSYLISRRVISSIDSAVQVWTFSDREHRDVALLSGEEPLINIGWTRIGKSVGRVTCDVRDRWKDWHVANYRCVNISGFINICWYCDLEGPSSGGIEFKRESI